jgi:fructose PTS system EIIB component
MSIKLVRIDDRLIHGQVATTWLVDFNIEQVIIVDDEIYNNEIKKSMVGVSAPSHVKVHVFGVQQFIEIYQKNPIKRATMLIFTNPINVLTCINGGVDINKVNVGGMKSNDNRRKLTKSVSVTPEEESAFKEIANKGIDVEIQMVPTEEITLMSKLL